MTNNCGYQPLITAQKSTSQSEISYTQRNIKHSVVNTRSTVRLGMLWVGVTVIHMAKYGLLTVWAAPFLRHNHLTWFVTGCRAIVDHLDRNQLLMVDLWLERRNKPFKHHKQTLKQPIS